MTQFIVQHGEFIIISLLIFLAVGCFTDGFGLFGRTYKGTWVKVDFDRLPRVLDNIKNANGFFDSDGTIEPLDIKVVPISDRAGNYTITYQLKIPAHVFHNVTHDVVLKKLGVK